MPESFRILLRKYLGKAELKSLASDGTQCTGITRGLLGRARITARKLVPVAKETDRRWEHGEDPSMVEPTDYSFEPVTKMAIVELKERKAWATIGIRRLIRESNLSQTTVYKILKGSPVRRYIVSEFRKLMAKIAV